MNGNSLGYRIWQSAVILLSYALSFTVALDVAGQLQILQHTQQLELR
jgi:hypothetical protein